MVKKKYTIKTHIQTPQRNESFSLKKEDLIDSMKLAGPLNTNKKYTTSKLTDLEDPVKKIPLSCQEIQNIFLLCTVNLTIDLFKKYQNFE